MKSRFIAILLAASLFSGFCASEVFAEETAGASPVQSADEAVQSSSAEETLQSSAEAAGPQAVTNITSGISSEDAFSGYVDDIFGDTEEPYMYPSYSIARRENLSDADLLVYDTLVEMIKKVSDGESASSTVSVNLAEHGFGDDFSLQNVLYALLDDYPYEAYWFDKTAGAYSTDPDPDGNIQIGLYVAKEYSASGARCTTDIGTAKTAAPRKAAALARSVAESQYQSDLYTALDYYRQWICDNTDYDFSAAGNGNTSYGDPWQMIYVFDENPSTKVVCEGYAKAFKYLADLYIEHAGLGKNFNCYLVSGTLTSSRISGAHMWNIVRMADGKNYIVDVTNCDVSTDSRRLFLVGASNIFTMEYPEGSGTNRTVSYRAHSTDGSDIRYSYEHAGRWGTVYPSLELYREDEITPSAANYDPTSAKSCFYDVMDPGTFYYEPVYSLSEAGIVQGTSSITFSPKAAVTRAQFVTFLYRQAGSPDVGFNTAFTDISGQSEEFRKAISWAADKQITVGKSESTFDPTATVTREEAVTFLFRYKNGKPATKTSSFKDVREDAYYADAINWGAENGVVNGFSADIFGIGTKASRADAVTFIYRATMS